MKVLFRSFEMDTANIVIGNYIKEDGFYMENNNPNYDKPCTRYYIQDENCIKHEVTPEYLSINFEDMLDSEDNPIFASLQSDGRGGDIIQHIEDNNYNKYPLLYKNGAFRSYFPFSENFIVREQYENYIILGIQQ